VRAVAVYYSLTSHITTAKSDGVAVIFVESDVMPSQKVQRTAMTNRRNVAVRCTFRFSYLYQLQILWCAAPIKAKRAQIKACTLSTNHSSQITC
jgi:hypothetical protein